MSVTLNGHTYSYTTDFAGYNYARVYAATGLPVFPDSIFTDMLATLAASPIITGGALAPATTGSVPVANGTSWVLSTAFAGSVNFTAATAFVVGVDPGGTFLVRIGGSLTATAATFTTNMNVTAAPSNTAFAGPWSGVSDATNSHQIAMQMNTSLGADWWYYPGNVKLMSLSNLGLLTLPAYGLSGGAVSAGPADSGGVGYSVLRVPN